uniref:Uncharacterized protein n=1 Tax=Anopheles minimus TaxID=112268 RepID=A0A182WMY0_9DIPT
MLDTVEKDFRKKDSLLRGWLVIKA